MSNSIIGLRDWLQTPAGRYLMAWEELHMGQLVADIFGYYALQLGMPELQALHHNRMPHRWLADTVLPSESASAPDSQVAPKQAQIGHAGMDMVTDFAALPFPSSSLDMVLLPHTLELSADPHATLREVERVLVPEGRAVLLGFNPSSLWGMQQRRSRLYRHIGWGQSFLPDAIEPIGYRRLRDWLRLLSLEVESSEFGCYRPSMRSAAWLQRFAWMDSAGARWWPILGAVYCVVAVKRVRGMRLLGAAWKPSPARVGKSIPLANSATQPKN